ncbi:rRNA maturation RNase YbeY [Gudongella sp. SC589]|jgi:probable rRNA maturation factor|uniref:rRNA maturation RNase YbeY n=1 Tax=Gudongella sp. SC589 TaxID=3385990 RepID=UPI003904DA62
MEVLFDNRQNKIRLGKSTEELLEKVIETTLMMEGMSLDYEISVSFVTNEEIRDLNNQFRNIDKETDVLSFPFDDEFETGVRILGDIVLSVERAMEQAEDFGHSVERELAYLTAHSTLHLIGYDHMTDDDKSTMRQKEKAIMKELQIFK